MITIKEVFAKSISIVFHPLLVPTYGFLLLMNSGFYFSLMNIEVKRFILLIVFLSTCMLPVISLFILSFNPRFDIRMEKGSDRVLPLLFTSVYYFVGYYLLGKAPVYPIYRVFLISTIFIIVLLLLISVRWKISAHMAGIGGLTGGILALSFRLGMNTSILLAMLIVAAGLIGSSRLLLSKHNPLQIYAGYFLGFAVNYLVLTFI